MTRTRKPFGRPKPALERLRQDKFNALIERCKTSVYESRTNSALAINDAINELLAKATASLNEPPPVIH